jgi:hypothetical protein
MPFVPKRVRGVVGAARDTITDITGAPRRAKNIIDDLFF